tara:strand:- start:361 stop:567 length:207 start_codon:yes stop_codon:yes gene_type:complete
MKTLKMIDLQRQLAFDEVVRIGHDETESLEVERVEIGSGKFQGEMIGSILIRVVDIEGVQINWKEDGL